MAVTPTPAPEASVEESREHSPERNVPNTAHQAHPVVDVRLDDLTQNRSLDELPVSAWLHLARHDDGTWSATEVAVTEGGEHRFRAIDDGPLASAVALQRNALDDHHLVVAHDYRFGVLRVALCDLTALWLRGDGHHHQMIVPLDPVPAHLVAGRSYPVDAFLDAVRLIACERTFAADDLTRVEGVGPHIEQVLHEAGVTTFAALAVTTPQRLREIMNAAGSRFHRADPSSWPEQAELAARGQWDELRAMHDVLKGGRTASDRSR